MNRQQIGMGSGTADDTRDLVRELRALGNVAAPAPVLAAVMTRLGLGDAYTLHDTPLGPVFVAYNDRGISAVVRADDAGRFEETFRARFGRPVYRAAALPARLARGVRATLGGRLDAALPLDLSGLTPFERAVLLKACEIPRGEVRPYSWIAREIGRPAAVRAAGSALAHNPIPLLIPCHRVVRVDGHIGQYGLGGPTAKRAILEAEGVQVAELAGLARAGIRYLGSDTTGVYCFPSCRHARRITPRHRVPFRSQGEAVAAGYRPCRVCRPADAA